MVGGWSCEKRCGESQSIGVPEPAFSYPPTLHTVWRCRPKAKTWPLTPSGRAVGSQRGRGASPWPEGPFLTPAEVLTLQGGWPPEASSGFGSGGLPAPTPFGVLTKSHPRHPVQVIVFIAIRKHPPHSLALSGTVGCWQESHTSGPSHSQAGLPVDKALSCGPAE